MLIKECKAFCLVGFFCIKLRPQSLLNPKQWQRVPKHNQNNFFRRYELIVYIKKRICWIGQTKLMELCLKGQCLGFSRKENPLLCFYWCIITWNYQSLCFCYLRLSLLSTEGAGPLPWSPPVYSSPEWTNQKLGLRSRFQRDGEIRVVVSCDLSSTLPMPLPGYQVEPLISAEASVDISSIKKGKEKLAHLFL